MEIPKHLTNERTNEWRRHEIPPGTPPSRSNGQGDRVALASAFSFHPSSTLDVIRSTYPVIESWDTRDAMLVANARETRIEMVACSKITYYFITPTHVRAYRARCAAYEAAYVPGGWKWRARASLSERETARRENRFRFDESVVAGESITLFGAPIAERSTIAVRDGDSGDSAR